MKNRMKIILASKSPRRKELLSLITPDFEVKVSEVDESLEEGLKIEEQIMKLSYKKAKTVFNQTDGDRVVIGSDTMVVMNNKIYGKPQDKEDAFNMLKDLSGRKHEVITGLSILAQKDGKYYEFIDYDITDVYFKNISDDDILAWINTGEATDKAGAYAVQGKFMIHIEKLDGNYSTVVGLPIHKVYDILKKELKLF